MPDGTIAGNPDLVTKMVAATSEAFQAAVDDPQAAVEAMDGKDPQMPDFDVLLNQWEETILLLHTDATDGEVPGVTAAEDWENTLALLSNADLISGDGTVEDYFDGSFAPGA